MPTTKPLHERLWPKVDPSGGCWLWTASKSAGGYGKLGVGGRTVDAHRVVYELLVGPIPADRELDHLCRVRNCVNPMHLEAVTRRENVRRSWTPELLQQRRAAQTHCKHGHEWTPENTCNSGRGRFCLACARANNARQAARKRG